MSQMKEKKGLADLTDMRGRLTARKFNLPTLIVPSLLTSDEAAEMREGVVSLVDQIRKVTRDIGAALADESNLDVRMNDIRKVEAVVGATVTADGVDPGVARTLGEAYIGALVENAPHNPTGLNHVADQALAVGVAHKCKSDEMGVKLPVTPVGGGKWDWNYISFPQSLYHAVRAIAAEVQKARNERMEAEKEAVEKGRGRLLDVLATGTGEAAFYVPDLRDGERFFGGGTVAVLVKDGLLHPLEACGKCQRVVERAVKVRRGLPLESLETGRLHFKERLPTEEFSAMRIFLSICLRGLEYAKEGKRRCDAVEAIRAKTTVPATSLVVHNQPGLTYLFCKQWQAKDLDGKP